MADTKYTDRLEWTIFYADGVAASHDEGCITADHLLWGATEMDKEFFRILEVPPEDVQKSVDKKIAKNGGRMPELGAKIETPLSTLSKGILASADKEAERLGRDFTDTEHLMLAILKEDPYSAAAKTLGEYALTRERIENAFVSRYRPPNAAADFFAAAADKQTAHSEPPPERPSSPGAAAFWVRNLWHGTRQADQQ